MEPISSALPCALCSRSLRLSFRHANEGRSQARSGAKSPKSGSLSNDVVKQGFLQGFWMHLQSLTVLVQLWRRQRRLKPHLFPWRFRRDLRTKGVGVVRIPAATIAPLRRIAEAYLVQEFSASMSQDFQDANAEQSKGALQRAEGHAQKSVPSFARADGLNAAFPSSMSWHWASDAATLEVFPREQVLKFLGDDFALVAASLVVANGDCMENVSKFHVDFGPPKIPRGVAATALMPLFPLRFPDHQGNLAPLRRNHIQTN